ncbi:hypothetical protein [Scytonema sp. PCC 10023]|uniref:hypothetical protein n=1 Tax=Scytonema sp. PCC 10023 TaxID=1680591 RepID=UPI0039C702C5
MRITKLAIIEAITVTLGASGTLAIIIGGGACLGGASATGVIKAGEFLSLNRPTYQRMMFYGGIAAGAGLFLVGAGVGIAEFVGDRISEEDFHLLDAEGAAIEEKQSEQKGSELPAQVLPEHRQRTWQEWHEYEEIKKFCRGCEYYQGGGRCALYQESKADCGSRAEKPSCSSCKYYSGLESLPCAVHPGLKENCPDWEDCSN